MINAENLTGSADEIFLQVLAESLDTLMFSKLFSKAVRSQNKDLASALTAYHNDNLYNLESYSLIDLKFSEILGNLGFISEFINVNKIFFYTLNKHVNLVYTYDNGKYDFKPDENEIRIQGDILQSILDNNSEINKPDSIYYLELKSLDRFKELLLNHPVNPISASQFLSWIFISTTHDYESASLQSKLFELAISLGADFAVATNDKYYALSLDFLCQSKSVLSQKYPEVLLKAAVYQLLTVSGSDKHKAADLVELAQKSGANPYLVKYEFSWQDKDEYKTVFEYAFQKGLFDCIDLFLKPYPEISISLWSEALYRNLSFDFFLKAEKRFPGSFKQDEYYEFARANGVSHSEIQKVIDLYSLAQDYINSINSEKPLLSSIEMDLLNPLSKISLIEDRPEFDLKNQYGFSPLHLAMISGKTSLAIEMIKNGYEVTETSSNGSTAFSFVLDNLRAPNSDYESITNLVKALLNHAPEIDVILNSQGDSLIDAFINNQQIRDDILNKTKDPLFKFLKKDANFVEAFDDPSFTKIAISHGEGFWSSGIWGFARLANQQNANVKFYLVTLDMIEKGGEKFINQFDGWINPGGGDDYPRDKKEFSLNDWKTSMHLIKTYQKALDVTKDLEIPYMGMCAGAQNFALYHGGSLRPLKGYNKGKHSIIHLKGTFSHFLAMDKENQKQTLKNCEFPEVIFKGDTAHNYAAITYKLGEGIELGAISEDGVAMTFAHQNGIRYATQFHPEHYYNIESGSKINHQKEWLNNFIHLATLHHEYKVGNGEHPEVIFENIGIRLKECIAAPNCLMDGQSIVGNATLEANYFDS